MVGKTSTVSNCANLWVCSEHWLPNYCLALKCLISRKVTEVSEIFPCEFEGRMERVDKSINRSNSSLVQDVDPRQSSM